MKNNFLVIVTAAALAACASNLDANSTKPMPVEITKDAKAEAAIHTTIDPQPEINQNINNINRHTGTVNSIHKPI